MPSLEVECAIISARSQIMLMLDKRAGRAPALVKEAQDGITLLGSDGLEEPLILNGDQGVKDLASLKRELSSGGIVVCEMEPSETTPTYWLAQAQN